MLPVSISMSDHLQVSFLPTLAQITSERKRLCGFLDKISVEVNYAKKWHSTFQVKENAVKKAFVTELA